MKATILTLLIIFLSICSLLSQNRKDSIIVFVGEIIEVKHFPEEKKETRRDTIIEGTDTSYVRRVSISMDSRFLAKYKILQLVYGTYKTDTIEFIVYDHYGQPSFSKHKTVLLFVSIYNGKLYHEKYQYFPLFLDNNGKWATPYPTSSYNHAFKDRITVKPEKIIFKDEVSYPIKKLNKKEVELWYPEPYYIIIKKKRAIAVYGNYVDDLFKLKQQTMLKARGIF